MTGDATSTSDRNRWNGSLPFLLLFRRRHSNVRDLDSNRRLTRQRKHLVHSDPGSDRRIAQLTLPIVSSMRSAPSSPHSPASRRDSFYVRLCLELHGSDGADSMLRKAKRFGNLQRTPIGVSEYLNGFAVSLWASAQDGFGGVACLRPLGRADCVAGDSAWPLFGSLMFKRTDKLAWSKMQRPSHDDHRNQTIQENRFADSSSTAGRRRRCFSSHTHQDRMPRTE